MNFRKAKETDLDRVAALYAGAIGTEGCTWSENYPTREDMEKDFQARSLYVLEVDGQVVGAASVAPEHDLDVVDCWSRVDGIYHEIARVVVDRSCAGQGYAVKMLALLLEELKVSGCRMVHLAVGCHHGAAIRTYEKLGFTFLKQCLLFEHDYYLCEKAL